MTKRNMYFTVKGTNHVNFNLTKSFKYADFHCKCGGKHPSPMNLDFVFKLEKMQDILGDTFKIAKNINSGFRCEQHNKTVGGSRSSFHLYGKAVDIGTKDSTERYLVCRAAFQIGFGDISVAANFVHIDDRDKKQMRIY